MGRSSKASTARLYSVASQQAGFFTTRQALASGYADNVHPYHVRNGDWQRVWRGIYRLTLYPETPRPELMVIWLWSQNRAGLAQGVFSHQTALSLLGQQAWADGPVHLTVPTPFRRNTGTLPVILHRGDVSPEDRTMIDTFSVTTVEKAHRDLGLAPVTSGQDTGPAEAVSPRRTPPARNDWAAWS